MNNRKVIYWASQITGWGLFVLGNIITASLMEEDISGAYVISTFIFVSGIFTTHIFRFVVHKWNWRTYSLPSLIPRVIISVISMSLVFTALNTLMVNLWVGERPLMEDFQLYEFLQYTLNFSALFLLWSIIYFAAITFRNWKKEEIQNLELRAAKTEIELNSFKAQMNPHFVGNSINAIQQFFYPPDPAKASEYIALFTRLLRQTMLFSEHNFITLREELQYDLDYLKMIHLRFGERFRFEIAGAEQIPDTLPFPAMLLQPILENATLHGLAPEGISRLCVEFSYSTGGILTCTICDNGVGINEMLRRKMESPVERKSKGMEILAKKVKTINRLFAINLRLDYKDLSETDPAGHGTCVSLSFAPEKIKNPVGNAGVSV